MQELERFFRLLHIGVWILLGGGVLFLEGGTSPLLGWVLFPLVAGGIPLFTSHIAARWIRLAADLAGIFGLGISTGVPDSPFLMFLILPLMEASLLFSRRVALAVLIGVLLFLAVGDGDIHRRYFLAGLFLLSTALGLYVRERVGYLQYLYERLRLDRKTILDNMASGVVAFGPSGVLLYDNPAARRMLSLRGYQALAREARKAHRARLRESEIHVDGRIFGVGWTPLPGNQGVLAIFQDITEKRRMEERLKALDRWATLGEFSAHLAHEIRSALMTLRGSFEMWDRLEDPARKARYRANVEEALHRLQDLVEQFLSFARVGSPLELQPFTLQEIARAVQRETGITPRISGEATVTTDIRRVLWIARNLIENARRYTPHVHVHLLGPSCPYRDSLMELIVPPKTWALVVRDHGPGIPRDLQSRIFEPFFTTEASGFGLGLAIVRESTQQLGGTLRLASREGEGTVFAVLFPTTVSGTSPETPSREGGPS